MIVMSLLILLFGVVYFNYGESLKISKNNFLIELSKQDIAYKKLIENSTSVKTPKVSEILTYSDIYSSEYQLFHYRELDFNSTDAIIFNLPVTEIYWIGNRYLDLNLPGNFVPSHARIFIKDSKIIASTFCYEYFAYECRDKCPKNPCQSMHKVYEKFNLTFPEFTKPANWKDDSEFNIGGMLFRRFSYFVLSRGWLKFSLTFIIGGTYENSLSQDELAEIMRNSIFNDHNYSAERILPDLILNKYKIFYRGNLEGEFGSNGVYGSAIYCETNKRVYIIKFETTFGKDVYGDDISMDEKEVINGLLNIKCPV